MNTLIRKYNVPCPRYTSYPTVPYWEEESFTYNGWIQSVKQSFHKKKDPQVISTYIHLTFCESLCIDCGCNKRINKQQCVEDLYQEAVLKEWKLYCDLFNTSPHIQ